MKKRPKAMAWSLPPKRELKQLTVNQLVEFIRDLAATWEKEVQKYSDRLDGYFRLWEGSVDYRLQQLIGDKCYGCGQASNGLEWVAQKGDAEHQYLICRRCRTYGWPKQPTAGKRMNDRSL
jgi:hypothetical protein